MNVFVNVTSLAHPLTGIGQYTANLVAQLLESDEIDDLKAICLHKILDRSELEELVKRSHSEARHSGSKISLRRLASKTPLSRRVLLGIQHSRIKKIKHELQSFVYWEPNYIRLPMPCNTLITLHDLSHIDHPEFHPAARVNILNKNLPSSIEHSTRILTVSNYSKSRINAYYHPKIPIDIAHPGVGQSFFDVSEQMKLECRHYFKLPEKFILSVATLEPRKNLTNLIHAYQCLPDSLKQQYPLVLSGGEGWSNHELMEQLSALQEKGQLIRLGYVPQHYLPALYACASLTAYVSLYEGFGMPIAESMAAGTPVLTSNRTSMPEVADDCAMYANPENITDITSQLHYLLTNPQLRSELATKGVKRAHTFSWQKSGTALISSLQKTAAYQ